MKIKIVASLLVFGFAISGIPLTKSVLIARHACPALSDGNQPAPPWRDGNQPAPPWRDGNQPAPPWRS